MAEMTELVVEVTESNPKWGYTRIRGPPWRSFE